MASQQGQAFEDLRNTLSECARIVRRRWRLALVGVGVVGTVAFWYSRYLPREYAATTIFERRDDVVLLNLIQGNSPYSFDHLKTTMTLDMTGSRALARAAVAVGLLPAETFTTTEALDDAERAALDGVLGGYHLTPAVRMIHSSANLDTIQLRCAASDPGIARRFVIALRDEYIADTRERIRDILSSTKDFFEAEIARLQQQLGTTSSDLQRGFADYPGVDPSDPVAVGSRLETIRAAHNEVFQRRAELSAQISAREEFLQTAPVALLATQPTAPVATASPAAPAPVPADPALTDAIRKAQQEIVDYKTVRRMTDEHPLLKQAYARLAALQELQSTLVVAAPASTLATSAPAGGAPGLPTAADNGATREWNAQRMRVELELDSLRRQYDVVQQQFDQEDARLTQFTALYERLVAQGEEMQRMRDRQTEVQSELTVWQGHLSRLERVLAAESGERGTQFTLVEEPKDVARPVSPRVSAVFIVCVGLGLAAAALAVALAELFDRSFRSMGQVTRILGIPVLESVGVISTPRERRRRVLSRLAWTPALVVLVLALLASAGLAYSSLELPSLYAHAIDRLRDSSGLDTPSETPPVVTDDFTT